LADEPVAANSGVGAWAAEAEAALVTTLLGRADADPGTGRRSPLVSRLKAGLVPATGDIGAITVTMKWL